MIRRTRIDAGCVRSSRTSSRNPLQGPMGLYVKGKVGGSTGNFRGKVKEELEKREWKGKI